MAKIDKSISREELKSKLMKLNEEQLRNVLELIHQLKNKCTEEPCVASHQTAEAIH